MASDVNITKEHYDFTRISFQQSHHELLDVIEADTRTFREVKALLTEGDVRDYMAAWELVDARLSGRSGIGEIG